MSLNIIYWKTLSYTWPSTLVHIVWEDSESGKVFGKLFRPDRIRIRNPFSRRPVAYRHVNRCGTFATLLAHGCLDAVRFSRDMPNSRKRLPWFLAQHIKREDAEAIESYVKNCWHFRKVRKPGYLWKCDD